MESSPATARTGLAIFVIIAVSLLLFSIVAGFSIGLLIIPIPLVMFGSIVWWSRPWIVAGLVSAAVVGSTIFLLTAPLTEFHRASVQGGVRRESGGCTRTILPDVSLKECDAASGQALAIAAASALLVGLGTGFVVRNGPRPRSS